MAKKRQRGNGQGTLFKRKGRGRWIAGWYDHNGKRQSLSTGTTDKAAAQQMLATYVTDVALRKHGMIDARSDVLSQAECKPLTEHLADFKKDLLAKDNTKQHACDSHYQATRLIELSKAERISDLTSARIQSAIGTIREQGRSLRTCNKALASIKGFSRWLVRNGQAAVDGLAYMKSYNTKTDRRHERRDLSPDEVERLFDAAKRGSVVLRMTGLDRAMAYRVAMGTGFRVGEMRSLTPRSFDLDSDPLTVTAGAAYSKRRKDDVQPIRNDLAKRVQPWLKGKPTDTPVFDLPHATAKMLRFDLKAANIPYRDEAGRVADFHSLRHTYITRVVESGATVKVAQELARHSDPKLTIGRYAHTRLHDLTQALDNLPGDDRSHCEDEAADLRATGTDDTSAKPLQHVQKQRQQYRQQYERDIVQPGASQCETDSDQKGPDNRSNPLPIATLSAPMRRDAAGSENAPRRTRTLDPRFAIPWPSFSGISGLAPSGRE